MMKLSCIVVLVLVLSGIGCSKRDLGRDDALVLLQRRTFPNIEGSVPADPEFLRFTGNMRGYNALMSLARDGALKCPPNAFCKPTASSDFIGGTLRYIAGTHRVSSIRGIRTVTPTERQVEAQVDFQPSAFYAKHESALDAAAPDTYAGPGIRARTQSRVEQFKVVLFDDGWRVE